MNAIIELIKWFFGDLAPFEVTLAGFVVYNFYMTVRKAKLSLFVGDTIRLVASSREIGGRAIQKIHIGCNLVNRTSKTATLHRLEATIENEKNDSYFLAWNLFFEYAQRGAELHKRSDAFPLSVGPKDTALEFIELKAEPPNQKYEWLTGKHKVTLLGWVNRESRKEKPNLETTFHIVLTPEHRTKIVAPQQQMPYVIPVSVEEWQRWIPETDEQRMNVS